MERLRREIVFNRKVTAYSSRLGWDEGQRRGTAQRCQNRDLHESVLQMVLSAVGEGALRDICPHFTSDSSTPPKACEEGAEEPTLPVRGRQLYLQARGDVLASWEHSFCPI